MVLGYCCSDSFQCAVWRLVLGSGKGVLGVVGISWNESRAGTFPDTDPSSPSLHLIFLVFTFHIHYSLSACTVLETAETGHCWKLSCTWLWGSDRLACLFKLRTSKFHCLKTESTPPDRQTCLCLTSLESYRRGECPCVNGVTRFGKLGLLCWVNVHFCPFSIYKYIVSSLSLSELLFSFTLLMLWPG